MESIYYRTNEPHIVYEDFGDEVVLINLDSGNYYSMNGTATEIWKLIEKNISLPGLLRLLSDTYEGETQGMINSTKAFIHELLAEKLIVPVDVHSSGLQGIIDRINNNPGKSEFVPPKLIRYTDMQDLILLDPIHDVDDTGWPNQKPDEPDTGEKETGKK